MTVRDMELFVVNRYSGSDAALSQMPDESELKKVLLEKAHQRKKLMEHKKHKKKTRDSNSYNSDADHVLDNVMNENEHDGSCVSKKIKDDLDLNEITVVKKKRKKDEESTYENTDKAKSKKKRKESNSQSEELVNSCSETQGKVGCETKLAEESKPFSVLGPDSFSKPTKVKRSIPQWLANPSVVSVDLKNLDTPINSISKLDKKFMKCLKNNNISHFFPVQSQIIPWLLENIEKPSFYWPNDICVSAPTGSGKTLAFVLPILQALYKRITPQIRALIILPVQDLAEQVYKVFKDYSEPTKLKVLLLSKKIPFADEQNLICEKDELNGFKTLVDIIVSTPGRLVDHLMNTNGLCLNHLKYLVIDEADRVMEDMQNDWLYHLNKKILSDSSKSYQTPLLTFNNLSNRRKLPQKLLFSATLSQDPEKLQQLGLFQPKLFTSVVAANAPEETVSVGRFIGKYTTPAELEEYYSLCTKATKPLVVQHLLRSKSWRSVLCFVNSTLAVKRLTVLLKKMNKGLKVKCISAELRSLERNKVIDDFAKGSIDVLISSDALARGMDIPNVKYVISYDRPKYLKTYIHRIGRTGRAGNNGVSLILLTDKEEKLFRDMIKEAGKKSVKKMEFPEGELEQYTEEYQVALKKLAIGVEKIKQKARYVVKSKKFKNKSTKKC